MATLPPTFAHLFPPLWNPVGADGVVISFMVNVNPAIEITTYQIEYGTTPAYGAVYPPQPADVDPLRLGDLFPLPLPISATISGLQSQTHYVYRIVLENDVGNATFEGGFTVDPGPNPPMVSYLTIGNTQGFYHGVTENLPGSIIWIALSPLPQNVTASIQYTDANGINRADAYTGGYDTTFEGMWVDGTWDIAYQNWPAGQALPDSVTLTIYHDTEIPSGDG